MTTPFRKWKHAIETFESHSRTEYHKKATIDAQSFLDVMRGKVDSVHMQLNQQAKDLFEDSKAKLRAIVETIVLCGRQDLALRGDKDSGRLTLEEPANNDGNFRALLRYRANGGDTVLVDHIQTAANNALYSSPRVQNEIISVIGKQIQDRIVSEVNKTVFFSVLADETSDISQTEQFSLCVRFVDPDTLCIREDFLSFVAVEDVSASSLAHTLKRELVKLGLQLEHMRGQGYDGAAVMSGEFRGVQAIIREEFPTALYTHCSSHSLNLCLSDASKVRDIQRAFGTIKEVCAFFRGSPKRTALLKRHLECASKSFCRLQRYCETRWVERHEAVSLFSEALPQIVAALEELIETARDATSASTASALHHRVCSFNFLICLTVCDTFLSFTHRLSEYLQSTSVDMNVALDYVDLVLNKLEEMAVNSEAEFRKIFSVCQKTASDFGVNCEMPRVVGTQKHRANFSSTSTEEYYRRATFIPYMDDLRASLERRFASHRSVLSSLQFVLPKHASKGNFESVQPAFQFYIQDMQTAHIPALRGEWEMWKKKWEATAAEEMPRYATDALQKCDGSLFPNVYTLLKLLATLPVTTATAERSFSTLKRVKTYLRNRTAEERLNGLALMSIHRAPVSVDEIISTFMKKPRRIVMA